AEADEADVHERVSLCSALWAEEVVRSMQVSTPRRALPTPTLPSPTRGEGKLRAHFIRVFAQRRPRAGAARSRRVHFRRSRIRDGPVWRADRDAAQMRMMGKFGGRVDLRKSEVGGGEFLRELRGAERGEFGGDFSVGLGAPFHALDIG